MNPISAIPPANSPTPMHLFKSLIDLAKIPATNYLQIQKVFAQLQQSQLSRFDFDYVIDSKQGSHFSKVLEIKAQQPYRFVPPIESCLFVERSMDGFIRTITIRVPEKPQFEERLFLKKDPNGALSVIFVQTDEKDFFACSNHVVQQGGEWHWSGSYLYGEKDESHTPEKMGNMFDNTYFKMLEFLNNPEFEIAYSSLQPWR